MTHSEPLPYLQRIRDWYLALGYAEPYRWAQHDRVAFTTPSKPLSASTLGLITTAAPTDRSTRRTRSDFAPRIAELCAEDGVDVAVLVPNCPVCHQSAALVANHLEASGIATVVMGCARDIVEHVGVPRLLFNDLPLGNAAGPPGDKAAQRRIATLALELLQVATGPRTTHQSPVIWPGRTDWKRDYSNPALLSDTELSARRAEFERVKRERDQSKHPTR